MNPDIAAAVDVLERDGVLPPGVARPLRRAARGELVSLHYELRLVLYLGVLLVVGGVSLLVAENLERLGPLTIAVGIGLFAAGCLGWAARRVPPFSWGQSASRDLAFDYVLLLGVLLAAADLAYVEVRFTPLGPDWPWHLLVVSLFLGVVSVRCDSRVVFSLALSTFAAWRGVSSARLEHALWWSGDAASVRANAVGCGVLFVALGTLARRGSKKPHFEPVAAHLGWALVLAALLLGADQRGSAACLLCAGAGLAAWAFGSRRFSLFAMGLLGAYAGLTALVLRGVYHETLVFGWFVFTAAALLGALLFAHSKMGGEEP